MRKHFFGTDGVRGQANAAPMDPQTLVKLAQATALQFMRGDHRHLIVMGKDTRLSGYMVETALSAGFVSMGMDVINVGPLPTPAVAMLTKSLRADLGVMISASHNPYQDNGVKLFDPNGNKLSDEIEKEIEAQFFRDLPLAEPAAIGHVTHLEDARGRYIEFVKSTFPKDLTLEGLKIVVDCAHGAAYRVAPLVLRELGATVIPIGIHPDGLNINRDCGATHPECLAETVRKEKAHLGFALDGDADRVLFCDEEGRVVDGDQIMALVTTQYHKAGRLKGNGLVSTIMSNMGLEVYLQNQGLHLIRTAVGDRYVGAYMKTHDYNVGGEQSGHIILKDYASAGDGLLAALQVLTLFATEKKSASEIFHLFDPWPQLKANLSVKNTQVLSNTAVQKEIEAAQKDLGAQGRLVVRPSGTEPLIRLMVESQDAGLAKKWLERLTLLIQNISANAA